MAMASQDNVISHTSAAPLNAVGWSCTAPFCLAVGTLSEQFVNKVSRVHCRLRGPGVENTKPRALLCSFIAVDIMR